MQPPSDAAPPTDKLQFDRAEYSADPAAPAVATCGICHNTLHDRYYDVNGKPACVACHDRTVSDMNRGSAFGRAFKALFLGLIAALIGAGVYFAISALTGYEIGLVAIVLGLFVGIAVRLGSNGRGGWFYQWMAVLLTYFAISVAYSSMLIYQMVNDPESLRRAMASGVTSQPSTNTPAASQETATSSSPSSAQESTTGTDHGAPASQSIPHDWSGASAGEKALTVAVAAAYIAAFLFALPVLSMTEQPIGILIIGFALWQAWVTNRGAKMRISGPYAVAGAAPPIAPPSLPNGPRNA